MSVIAPKTMATAENDVTKPSAIRSGRVLLVWATDAPRSIGRTGNVHGAATVAVPASRATTALSIAKIRVTRTHRDFAVCAGVVTLAVSRLRELCFGDDQLFARSATSIDCMICSEMSRTAPGACDRNSVLVLSISPIDLMVSKYWVIITSCITSEVEALGTPF
jgi:hypothetical protein